LFLLARSNLDILLCFTTSALRWEFIKENKKVKKQENTLSTKKAIKKKKEKKKKDNTLSTKKVQERTKEDNGQEKKKENNTLDQESDQDERKNFLFLIVFLVDSVFSFFFFFLLSCSLL